MECAREELLRIGQQPARPFSAAFLFEKECEASARLLLAQPREAERAARELLDAWEQCLRSDDAFARVFGLSEDSLHGFEERAWMADLIEDGVQFAINTERNGLLALMDQRLGHAPPEGDPTAAWARALPLPRLLLRLHAGEKTLVQSELDESWELWLEEGQASEAHLAWKGLRAIVTNDLHALHGLLEEWRTRQREQLTRLAVQKPKAGLRSAVAPTWLLELLPACLVRLGRRNGLALP